MEREILSGLVQRGIPEVIARGIVSEMNAESGLNPGINEISPVVPGSRGGYGLNQWTGPRRRQFEAFAAQRGVSPDDLQAQLDFTVWELQNTERAAWDKLQGARSPEDAARVYQSSFLRPGKPRGVNVMDYGPVAPTQNALQPQQMQPQSMPQFRIAQANPADFMVQRNALSRIPLQYQRTNALGRP